MVRQPSATAARARYQMVPPPLRGIRTQRLGIQQHDKEPSSLSSFAHIPLVTPPGLDAVVSIISAGAQ